jgi:hypothetical protein
MGKNVNTELETVSPHGVADEQLKEWIESSATAAGFEVW